MPNVLSISLVEIDSLPSQVLAGNNFLFSLPGVDSNLFAWGHFIQKSLNGDYVLWTNLGDGRGYFGISSSTAGKVAYAEIDGEHYMMHLLSNRYNALVKLDTANTNALPQLCPPELEVPENLTVNSVCEEDDNCAAVVSVLVLVTPESTQWFSGTYSSFESALYMLLGLHTVNFALINSGVYNKSVRFNLIEHDFDFAVSGNPQERINTDFTTFTNDAVAHARRNFYRADLMVLLSDTRYFPTLGAALLGSDRYLAVVSMEYLFSPTFTFAHEMGHLFYLNHNRVSNGGDFNYESDEFCAFGWRYQTPEGAARRSIMAILKPEDQEPGARGLLTTLTQTSRLMEARRALLLILTRGM